MNPDGWTLRELVVSRDARLEADWWHTANLLAQVYNLNRGKGKPPAEASKFHPTVVRKPKEKKQQSVEEFLRILAQKADR